MKKKVFLLLFCFVLLGSHVSAGSVKNPTLMYRVQKGDTLYSIAKTYQTTVKEVQQVNGLKYTKIHINQMLKVPYHENTFYKHIVKKGETLLSIAKKYGVNITSIQKQNRVSKDVKTNQQLLIPKAKPSTLYSSKAGKQLCIFYAWSSSVNGANGNVTKAVQEYQKCHVIVLGAGMESKTHGDHAKTKQIISMLKRSNPKTEVYGYINIGVNTTNTPIITLQKEVKEWKGMGVTGIFVDEAGYDYQVTRKRQLDVMNFIHSQGMNVFANAWNMQDVLSPYDEKRKLSKQPLQKGDWVLLEDLFAGFSSFDKDAFQRIQTVQKEAGKQGVRVAGVSTVKQSTECLTNKKIAQYGWVASYLFDIEAFQCSDMFFGSQNEKLITYPSGFLGLSGQTKWLTIQPTQTKKSWVRETKNEKYVLDKTTFAFSKERK